MILTGPRIHEEVESGAIIISPFDTSCLNPNSYNFTLADVMKVYDEDVVDTRRSPRTRDIAIGPAGYVLTPYQLYLASTRERIGSTKYVPTYAARSSIARLGMFINLSAPLGDIGFVGNWTIQLFALHPIRVYAGMRVGQMMFWTTKGEIELYDGKYQGASGPMASQIYRDSHLLLRDRPTKAALDEET